MHHRVAERQHRPSASRERSVRERCADERRRRADRRCIGIADGHGLQVSTKAATPFYLGYTGATHDGFQGWFIKAELPWEFRENVVLSPYHKYADADGGLASDINSFEGGQEHLIGGVKIAVGF